LAESRRGCIWLSGRAPLIVLALVSALSLGARAYRLDAPCVSPCRTASAHALISDESFYVSAAQVIAGIRPPRRPTAGQVPTYQNAPLGTDPNGEHPQGAKLVIAGAIELLGDGPFAWRIGSVLFGSLAILGMYALVRAAGGGQWLAVGAATLMAADNLMIIWGRIAFLDIYALAPMIWGVALYLRGRVGRAAALLAVADCMKEVSIYALLVLGLVELFRMLLHARATDPADPLPAEWAWRPALARLAIATVGSAALLIVGLWVMGLIAPPFSGDSGRQHLITGGPLGHLAYIINFAKGFRNAAGSQLGFPWQWWYDHGWQTLLRVNPSARACHVPPDYPSGVTCLPGSLPGRGPQAVRPVSALLMMISPPILALATPALVVCAVRAARRRLVSQSPRDVGVAVLALAWTIGTWLPFELQNLVYHRISWLYYMVIVMPGVYVAVTDLACLLCHRRSAWLRGAVAVWGLTVLAAAVVMFPFVATFSR
jgi:4-amino-4-deoxy-L-arabinose transferase-like glycosyltransferase